MQRMVLSVAWMILLAGSAAAQPAGTVAGRVINEDGKPIPGATVRIVGTTLGVISKRDGSFEIRHVPIGSSWVIVTSVGYSEHRTMIEITDGSSRTLMIELSTKVPVREFGDIPPHPPRPERMGTAHRISFNIDSEQRRASLDLQLSMCNDLFGEVR